MHQFYLIISEFFLCSFSRLILGRITVFFSIYLRINCKPCKYFKNEKQYLLYDGIAGWIIKETIDLINPQFTNLFHDFFIFVLLFVCLLWFEAWYVSEPQTSCRYHPSIGSIYSNRLCFGSQLLALSNAKRVSSP